ncbi:3c84e128-f1de-43d7-801a-cfc28ad50328-CDS [Sclerotinia trifoliorum]|uniref:3c84e128-f1de-43d7-801a-cfc28ad50328-CDS n=1 Tax=Sclerotinia trifoliorum TaxID=28548 RepID=A0A8H2VXQ9_9HELO|nr:3c84e128-f1de-43d7-801a-cfc28ad50328-CDS [Sclerotinia trifoliorum]
MTAPTSWTVLHTSINRNLSDNKTEDVQKWLEIIKPVTKVCQPGLEHGVWVRLIELGEEVWLVTAWEAFEAIQQFEQSDAHKKQLNGMKELSEGREPIVTHAGLSGDFWNMLTEYTGIMDVYFPGEIDDRAKKRVEDLRGLVYFFAPGKKSGKSAYSGRATKG